MQATASLASDDRFRGRSVSQGRPVAGLDLSYDAPNGAYVGAAVTGVDARHDGLELLAVQEYAGFVTRLAAGPGLDLGVSHAGYTRYYSGEAGAQYTELYAGLITERFASHLFYSPGYFGRHDQTLYGEVDAAVRPFPGWRLSGHAGVLTVLSGVPPPEPPGLRPTQFDWRLGLATAFRGFELELSGSGVGPDRDYYAGAPRDRAGAAVALRRRF